MTIAAMLVWIALAFSVGGAIFNLLAARRTMRLMRHASDLDQLLASLCVQAYAQRHRPIWAAWTAAMGEITVEVTATRKPTE